MFDDENDNINSEALNDAAEAQVADSTDEPIADVENLIDPSLAGMEETIKSVEEKEHKEELQATLADAPLPDFTKEMLQQQAAENAAETISEEAKQDSISEPAFKEPPQATTEPVTVQPVQFAAFDEKDQVEGEANKNLDILMDIKLQLTVELGRTELPVRKLLELTRGSIVELEKVAGEPVELYANGKLVAHGEVVVIEDNFGLRITSITNPDDRLKGIS